MKFKVTIELEEGVKNTVTRSITAEAILLSANKKDNRLTDILTKEAGAGAMKAMRDLCNFLADNGSLVVEYEEDGLRKTHMLYDLADVPLNRRKRDK